MSSAQTGHPPGKRWAAKEHGWRRIQPPALLGHQGFKLKHMTDVSYNVKEAFPCSRLKELSDTSPRWFVTLILVLCTNNINSCHRQYKIEMEDVASL